MADEESRAENEADAEPAAPPSTPKLSVGLAGGAVGRHPGATKRSLPVAATVKDGVNTLRFSLLPIACWKLEDLRFDFDSSFLRPDGADEMASLLELRKQHAGSPISIFGHADPTGKDDYNKTLSGRRALALHALLVRDVDRWESFYSKPFGGDDWGVRSIQHMLGALGFDPGVVDGKQGAKTTAAARGFQEQKRLTPDGKVGPLTRKELFTAYMDFLCRDAQGDTVVLTADDFLARDKDPKHRGDVQGCSEFNPVLVLSVDEDKQFADPKRKTERDVALLPDRRVMVFLFVPGVSVDPGRWPCPAAEDGPSQCQAQFFPDADARRAPTAARRLYEVTHDTMACKFYDRMARRSPCEVTRSSLMLRLLNHDGEVVPDAVYRVKLASGEVRRGQTGKDGWLVEQNVETPATVRIEWGYPPDVDLTEEERTARWEYPGPFGYETEITLDAATAVDDETQAKIRLGNLGYNADRTFAENLIAFQREYQIFPATGELDDATKTALRDAADEAMSRSELLAKRKGGA